MPTLVSGSLTEAVRDASQRTEELLPDIVVELEGWFADAAAQAASALTAAAGWNRPDADEVYDSDELRQRIEATLASAKDEIDSSLSQKLGVQVRGAYDPAAIASTVTSHHRDQVQQLLLDSWNDGLSVEQTAALLADVGQSSALMVARTSLNGINNSTSLAGALFAGVKVKEWLATADDRTRESHVEMDGQAAPIDGVFDNGCRFPGDPNGPPEEVINCRCALVYQQPIEGGAPESLSEEEMLAVQDSIEGLEVDVAQLDDRAAAARAEAVAAGQKADELAKVLEAADPDTDDLDALFLELEEADNAAVALEQAADAAEAELKDAMGHLGDLRRTLEEAQSVAAPAGEAVELERLRAVAEAGPDDMKPGLAIDSFFDITNQSIDELMQIPGFDVSANIGSQFKVLSQYRLRQTLVKDPRFRPFNPERIKHTDQSKFDAILRDPFTKPEFAEDLKWDSTHVRAQDTIEDMVSQWAGTSGDHSPGALRMQAAAAEEFGVPLGKYLTDQIAFTFRATGGNVWAGVPDWVRDSMRAMARHQYDLTQAEFARQGVTHVFAYRGISVAEGIFDERTGRRISAGESGATTVESSPLSSWSVDDSTSMEFATQDDPGGAYLLSASIPVERVFSMPLTGFGCVGEYEFVILGGNDHVHIANISLPADEFF